MTEQTITEVTRKLIGPTMPVGETTSDILRLENLKKLIAVVDALLVDLDDVAQMREDPRHSVMEAAHTAYDAMSRMGIDD